MSRPEIVIDMLAIAPFYLGILVFASNLKVLWALRLVRFFRLFKLARYSKSVARFERVVRWKTDDLLVAIGGASILLLLSSSLMYFIEHTPNPRRFRVFQRRCGGGRHAHHRRLRRRVSSDAARKAPRGRDRRARNRISCAPGEYPRVGIHSRRDRIVAVSTLRPENRVTLRIEKSVV